MGDYTDGDVLGPHVGHKFELVVGNEKRSWKIVAEVLRVERVKPRRKANPTLGKKASRKA